MIESIIIRDITTNEDLYMDKLTTPNFILDYIDWGQASVSQNTTQYINQIGVTVVGVTFKSRNIDISGFIIADSELEMTNLKSKINNFFNPIDKYEVLYKDYKIGFRVSSSVRYTNTEEKSNNEVICKFKVSGICPYPLFSIFDDIQFAVREDVGMFRFPFSVAEEKPIIFGINSIGEYHQRVIKNIGQIPIGFKFTMRSIGNVVRNPTLYNFSTGEHLTLNTVLENNEQVEINTTIGSKYIVGKVRDNPERNYIQYMTNDSSWLTLAKGDNLIGYSAEAGIELLKIELSVSPRFLEVQECF